MNQQPDKFFREKLADYQQAAPASAWTKIAATQKKKSHHMGWMKVAASLLLISIAAYLLWPQKRTVKVDQHILAEKNKSALPAIALPPELHPPNAMPQNEKLQENPVPAVEQLNPVTKPKRRVIINATPQPDVILATAQANIATATSPIARESISADESSSETNLLQPGYTMTPEATAMAPQNITLTYTAEDVNKYLDKKSMAQATSEEKKPSTLMKLLKKASDLKNNQDPMGELRQKKNEILALNFKNEKQRGQNK